MRIAKTLLAAATVGLVLTVSASAGDDLAAKGEKIFKNKKLGNCQACHDYSTLSEAARSKEGAGTLGPKLSGLMYWTDDMLYNMVYDPYANHNGRSKINAMPAFGKNGWLSDNEIRAVVAFLKTIK